jgi:hypothetical protein
MMGGETRTRSGFPAETLIQAIRSRRRAAEHFAPGPPRIELPISTEMFTRQKHDLAESFES